MADIAAIVGRDPQAMAELRAARALTLPDWCIAAGFVRNRVWDTLIGRNEAPQLAGANFMTQWGARTTNDLYRYIQAVMPPGNGGTLGEESYLAVTAYILQSNGARPGTQALTAVRELGAKSGMLLPLGSKVKHGGDCPLLTGVAPSTGKL